MARAGKRVKFDLLRICRGNGAGHIARHEPVVLAVNEQDRHPCALHGGERVRLREIGTAEELRAQAHEGVKHLHGNGRTAPDGADDVFRARIRAVGDHTADVFRQAECRRHEHRRRAHGNAAEQNGDAAEPFGCPARPEKDIIFLHRAEGDRVPGAAALSAFFNEQQRAAHRAVDLRPDAEIARGRAAVTVARDHERRARLCRIIPPREPQPVGRGDVHALARQRVERVDGAGYLFPVDLHLRVFRYVMVVVLRAAGRIKCVAVQPIQSAERGKRRSGRGAERLCPLDHNQSFFPAHYTTNRPQYN